MPIFAGNRCIHSSPPITWKGFYVDATNAERLHTINWQWKLITFVLFFSIVCQLRDSIQVARENHIRGQDTCVPCTSSTVHYIIYLVFGHSATKIEWKRQIEWILSARPKKSNTDKHTHAYQGTCDGIYFRNENDTRPNPMSLIKLAYAYTRARPSFQPNPAHFL